MPVDMAALIADLGAVPGDRAPSRYRTLPPDQTPAWFRSAAQTVDHRQAGSARREDGRTRRGSQPWPQDARWIVSAVRVPQIGRAP
ncbi:hypothetical protein FraEuI1c_4112 [Pseudofrankia inefficax]|uniref:Uncharacterized protein n=1 Tax=Pseudofrankia inefficax (strain DSM 45817 / CECT 9037 / DDB 130130 / EuI1c) TaxID=298654 RepID=E3J994_PSEI1|nr:hypothetical protein FraEuI1c_4112 [Pseudofrankia inefficax]